MSQAHGRGILAWQSSNIAVKSCHFEYVQGFCVRIMGSKQVKAHHIRVVDNRMLSLQAYYEEGSPWGWTADGIQFIRVEGPDNCISNNICFNQPGKSYLTDFINVYCSSGTQQSPLRIENNTLVGAGSEGLYNQYGCGIQLNDHPDDEDGGEYVEAIANVLVDPGVVGMNINGGYRAKITNNKILMSASVPTNLLRDAPKIHPAWAAITLFNYSGGISRDSDHEIRNNQVAFHAGQGTLFINKWMCPP